MKFGLLIVSALFFAACSSKPANTESEIPQSLAAPQTEVAAAPVEEPVKAPIVFEKAKKSKKVSKKSKSKAQK